MTRGCARKRETLLETVGTVRVPLAEPCLGVVDPRAMGLRHHAADTLQRRPVTDAVQTSPTRKPPAVVTDAPVAVKLLVIRCAGLYARRPSAEGVTR